MKFKGAMMHRYCHPHLEASGMKKLLNHPNMKIFLFILAFAGFPLGPSTAMLRPTPAMAAQIQSPLLDLVFVIDNSGSMKKNDPNFITPKVVETFIRQLPGQSQVGMVLFDQNARLLKPMTGIGGPQAEQSLIAALKGIDYRGQHTNTPAGIERAIYELKSNGRPLAQKGIVFMTDGIVDTGDPQKDLELTEWLKQDLTAQCRELGIRIFGIALSEAADFSLIQALAQRTDGEYFRTYQASEIFGVLKQIQAHMTPAPKPELAPLPLLPVPPEKPKNELLPPAQPARIEAPKSAPAENAVVVSEKSVWIVFGALALIIAALITTLIFFYIQNIKNKAPAAPAAGKHLDIPEARLEDLDKVCGPDKAFIPLDKARINIGRSQRNHVVIQQPAISGFHAAIEFRNMSFYLDDLGSTNGTQLNGRRLKPREPVRLKSGDRITFARFEFKFIVVDQIPFGDTVMLAKTALTDPQAEATIVLDLDGSDSQQGLISCMQNHLMQIYGLGPKYKVFVNTFFAHDTLDIIATAAHENLQLTASDGKQYCSPINKNKAFYVVCSLPAAIDQAADWFGTNHNGFTQFIFKWIRSKQYQSAQCDQLCVVTFGQEPATWVSITIVPTHSEPEPVEIMSVDFLNEEEKSSLALDYDNHGRVI
jgi:pSer/pThr/pTyr-binding forkhead associated (FHA) protein/Mg-chelatase subunit ChlD